MATLTITKTNVLAIAPELADALVTDATWTLFIGWAGDEISLPLFGTQARVNRLGTYLVAHLASQFLTSASGSGGGAGALGAVTQVKVGNVSTSYAAGGATRAGASVGESALSETAYGREYLRLMRIFMGGSATVAGGLGPVSVTEGW